MPDLGVSFEQSYNAKNRVVTKTMLVITTHFSQACNDKREVEHTRETRRSLPKVLGTVRSPPPTTATAARPTCRRTTMRVLSPASDQARVPPPARDGTILLGCTHAADE